MTATATAPARADGAPTSRRGIHLEADGVVLVRRGRRVLQRTDLRIEAGSVVAVIGPSGAGKTSLLAALSGARPLAAGEVRYDGVPIGEDAGRRHRLASVPQDDIVHRALGLRATLRHAARLRLPATTTPAQADRAVDDVLAVLDLTDRADVRVADLSGGQRKRASIAVELLADPRVCFLDEPTSGLDPHAAAGLVAALGQLAARGCTVVFTTHHVDDVAAADAVVVVGKGGVVRHVGPPAGVPAAFGVARLDDVYGALAAEPAPDVEAAVDVEGAVGGEAGGPATPRRAANRARRAAASRPTAAASTPGPVRQWRVLARRDLAVARADRATTAVMLGGPAMVLLMFVVLFRRGSFAGPGASPTTALTITHWLAFAAFFFGVTYGLLQICAEQAVVRRERRVGLHLGAYLAAKLTLLVPALALVDVAVLAVLRALDVLPSTGTGDLATLAVTLLLDAVAAAALGLLASAVVTDAVQAALALPVLCFPTVLFSGGVQPVAQMPVVGRAISVVVPDRWAFEASGRALALDDRFAGATDHAVTAHAGAFTGGVGGAWLALALLAAGALVLGYTVLVRRLGRA